MSSHGREAGEPQEAASLGGASGDPRRPKGTFQQPTPDQLVAFHAGDPIAIDEVVQLVLPQLRRWAVAEYNSLDFAEIESTLNQVLAETCVHHERYDRARSAFTTYVIRLFKLRLNDVYSAARRDNIHRDDSVFREAGGRETYTKAESIDHDLRVVRNDFFRRVGTQLDEEERAMLQLILRGQRDSQSFAAVLEKRGNLVDPEREVKNAKERLLRKVRRISQGLGFDAEDLL